MAQKKALTDEELFAQFEGIGDDDNTTAPSSKAGPGRTPKPAPPLAEAEDDPLAELENLAKTKPASRPNTPRLSSKRAEAATPSSTGSARTSEERFHPSGLPRKSGESTRSYHQSFTPASEEAAETEPESEAKVLQAPPAPEPQKKSGGGWWGGIFATATATASAAVKQAEAAVKEIQKNEEAQRWAEQVKGNVSSLRNIGGELRSKALPTFTTLLHTLAPPISQHERLQIHITHDLLNYPSLDPTIHAAFSRVMSQVEGGSLLVLQRGSESTHRRASSDAGFAGGGGGGGGASGWSDGPWWRQAGAPRSLGAVAGLAAGTKLARAAAEGHAADFFAARGGVEEAARRATQVLGEGGPVRSSDIFLAVQAARHSLPPELFGGAPGGDGESGDAAGASGPGAQDRPERPDELVCFAVYLHDPIHGLSFRALTQSLPAKWADWLDAPAAGGDGGGHGDGGDDDDERLPADIREIVEGGGVDPREWVSEWMEEAIALGVGVVAQRYVARRMGVGEGGIGRGKRREEVVESGGGEAARAI